jgi:hypothetical protein
MIDKRQGAMMEKKLREGCQEWKADVDHVFDAQSNSRRNMSAMELENAVIA